MAAFAPFAFPSGTRRKRIYNQPLTVNLKLYTSKVGTYRRSTELYPTFQVQNFTNSTEHIPHLLRTEICFYIVHAGRNIVFHLEHHENCHGVVSKPPSEHPFSPHFLTAAEQISFKTLIHFVLLRKRAVREKEKSTEN